MSAVSWNGKKVAVTSKDGNMITATLEGPSAFTLPPLGPWKVRDSLPEIAADYVTSPDVWISKSSHRMICKRRERM